MAWRLAVSTDPMAATASVGSRSNSRRATPACTPITLTWWATTSCSSRAIRTRSSSTARRALTSRCWSSWRLRSSSTARYSRSRRIIVPSGQASKNGKASNMAMAATSTAPMGPARADSTTPEPISHTRQAPHIQRARRRSA
jgi:hypothetical protein